MHSPRNESPRVGTASLRARVASANDTAEFANVPAWLDQPPNSEVKPPVSSRHQALPIGELTWENFERLSVRLVRTESDVEHCQLYGDRGAEQHGIDLYARQKDGQGYSVYQCRRVRRFTAAALRAAVQRFLEGAWSGRANRLVVFTTVSAVSAGLADELERQAVKLKPKNIRLELFCLEALSSMLKAQPVIVDDFFGRSWVHALCGTEAAASLGERLDANQVVSFRRALREFYGYVFNLHDPGIPIAQQPGNSTIPLVERYVLPDVVASEIYAITAATRSYGSSAERAESAEAGSQHQPDSASVRQPRRQHLRESVVSWLSKSERSIVLGSPGTGKSSLLRYLVLDLMSDAPALEPLAGRWAQRLPVWVPFAFWTKLIANQVGASASLLDCIKQWFAQWNKDDLWPLVAAAIKDQRLLLVVDGLDEWTTPEAGRIGSHLLQAFVETQKVSVVLTSRPYGARLLQSFSGQEWQTGELAPLSEDQRAVVCSLWFRQKAKRDAQQLGLNVAHQQELASTESIKFRDELDRSIELSRLAETPLLLVLLLYMRFQNAALPRRRFDAYERILDHLLREHPAAKRVAAFVVDSVDSLTDSDVRLALAQLAFTLQANDNSQVVTEDDLERVVFGFLTDRRGLGLGLEPSTARSMVPAFSRVVEGSLGIMVRQGVHELSFLHRSFQEFLASLHMSRLPLLEQEQAIKAYGGDARWREVFLGLVWRTRRPDEIDRLVSQFQMQVDGTLAGLTMAELLAEIAFGDFACPPNTAAMLADAVFENIERHWWMPHRRRLLSQCLEGLQAVRLRERVRHNLRQWVFARVRWRPSIYDAMAGWPNTPEVVEFLVSRMHEEEVSVQRSAARSLASVAAGDRQVGDTVGGLALRAPDPLVRAAALEALVVGWPKNSAVPTAVASARNADSYELRLAAMSARTMLGVHDEQDYQDLVRTSQRERSWEIDFGWSDALPECLQRGWPGRPDLRAACLRSAYREIENGIDRDIAFGVLLNGFPGDPEVAEFFAQHIRREQFPLSSHSRLNSWDLLSRNFADEPALVAALDEWAPRQKHSSYEISFAARLGRTSVMKRACIDNLMGAFPHWAARALVEIWGMHEPEVSEPLLRLARGPAAAASQIAFLIPQIIPDQSEARTRLLEILRDSTATRRDFAVRGLALLPDRGDEAEIVRACLDVLATDSPFDDSIHHTLIREFSHVAQVRELARDSLEWREPPLSAVASAYSDDPILRTRVMENARPLPTTLRLDIVDALDRFGGSFAVSTLSCYDSENDEEVRTAASIAYHAKLRDDESAVRVATERLRRSICAYGPDYEARRRAALAGLIVLERLDVMTELRESIGEGQPISIGLSDGLAPNVRLVRLLAKRWRQFKDAFPGTYLSRLSNNDVPAWAMLCLGDADNPDFSGDVVGAIRADARLREHPYALSFLSRVKPRSVELLEACRAAVNRPVTAWHGRPDAAAVTLAEHFGGDIAALQQLLAGREPTLSDEGLVLALCAGWPDHPSVASLLGELQRGGTSMSYQAMWAVIYAALPSSQIIDRLTLDVERAPRRLLPHLASVVVRRLRRDGGTRSLFARLISESASTGWTLNVPRLLAAAGGLGPREAKWCEAEVQRLASTTVPEICFDLFEGRPRPLAASLLDALEGGASVGPM